MCTEKPFITIEEICAAFDAVELETTEPIDEFDFRQFDPTPEEIRQTLAEYTEATIAIKYQPRVARKLVGAVNDYVDSLETIDREFNSFNAKPQNSAAIEIGYYIERANSARRKIAKQYKRVGDFNPTQLKNIVAYLMTGLATARNKG